jgi:signal transduction histidine kinase
LRSLFKNLTFNQQFMLAGLVILLAGLVGIGAWVEQQIVTGVIHRTGITTALYVDSFVAPNLQELGHSETLLPEHREALSKLLQNTPMGQQIVEFKVWNTRGRLLYSTDQSLIGKSFPMTEGLLRARLGEVISEISPLEDEENKVLGELHSELLETYSPVWLSGTNQIIAVAEFYQITDDLNREINVLKRRSWLVVGLAILIIYLLLAVFVRRASDTITNQQAELSQKVAQLTGLLAQNRELHERVQRAAASVALLNEGYLRRVGAELHDGPAQDLGLSLLKLDAFAGKLESQPGGPVQAGWSDQIAEIEASLKNALKEIRGIATGLSLPHLAELGLAETIIRVVRAHERRTGTRVTLEQATLPDQVELPVKITIYRLIQEALNNAYRHAGGAGQRVLVSTGNNELVVEISDTGPGFYPEQAEGWRGRLGLAGMRERVESLGGLFQIESQVGQGTKILARLPFPLDGGIDR